jgi:hypothetical protein
MSAMLLGLGFDLLLQPANRFAQILAFEQESVTFHP